MITSDVFLSVPLRSSIRIIQINHNFLHLLTFFLPTDKALVTSGFVGRITLCACAHHTSRNSRRGTEILSPYGHILKNTHWLNMLLSSLKITRLINFFYLSKLLVFMFINTKSFSHWSKLHHILVQQGEWKEALWPYSFFCTFFMSRHKVFCNLRNDSSVNLPATLLG